MKGIEIDVEVGCRGITFNFPLNRVNSTYEE